MPDNAIDAADEMARVDYGRTCMPDDAPKHAFTDIAEHQPQSVRDTGCPW